MGHFFRMEDGWADVEECWSRVKQACVPSLSCSRHDANGFFFYLGVGDFRVLLRWMIKEERMKYFIGFRAGNVYLYGRKEVELLIKLLGKGKNHGRLIVTGKQHSKIDRKSTRLNSSHSAKSRMPSSA